MRVTFFNRDIETAERELLEARQVKRLQTMLRQVLATNGFYRQKLGEAGLDRAEDIRSLDDLRRLPFTIKHELVEDQAAHLPFGTNLTFPLEQYIRLHQTSGTTGRPLRWLDTPESWNWWARCWGAVYRGAGVGPGDRVFFAFSFGPFIGFWSAWEGTRWVDALAISGGAQNSEQRLHHLLETEATAICCTPSYALHLAEVARENGLDIAASSVQRLIVAGEPGANIPATRRRIEEAWNAQLFDHTGATEVGAHGFECLAHAGVHLNEGEFIVEVIDPTTGEPADEGELVITNLGRVGMPIIRYRTGDQVRLARERCECGRTFVRMEGGIIGRIDDMFIVRGVNVFPSAIENIVRSFPQVDEFAIEVYKRGEMDELELKIEALADDPQAVAQAVQAEMERRLAFRVPVHAVEAGSLPRWELKARRVVDRRR
ncbi:MAG: phenylacetate--CoA ligase family protein [Anaerolineae bacterium]